MRGGGGGGERERKRERQRSYRLTFFILFRNSLTILFTFAQIHIK